MYRLSGRTRGRALRDVGYAAVASLALGVLLVRFVGAPPLAGIAAVAVGMVPVSVGALCIARRRPLFSTPADRLTLTRAVLAGDRLHDIEAAHANHIPAIGAGWGYGGRAELERCGATVVLDHASELPKAAVLF